MGKWVSVKVEVTGSGLEGKWPSANSQTMSVFLNFLLVEGSFTMRMDTNANFAAELACLSPCI